MLSTRAANRPNFLWLISEDMGPALSCYGRKEVKTPNLDRLAAEGVRYDRFYTVAPVCSASRSAFMTGMYQNAIGAHHHRSHRNDGYRLPDGVRLLTEWLRDAGYRTANLTQLPPPLGFNGSGKTDWNFTPPERPFDTHLWEDVKEYARTKTPWLAQINFQETHRKFHAPKVTPPAKVTLPPYYPDHPAVREDYAAYLDSAVELDRKVGALLAQMERDGMAENTVVLFMGDNGEAHIRGKQFCYEEGLRVPFIVRWPKGVAAPRGFRPGSVDRELRLSIDVAPTILALAGAAIPPKMQGSPLFGDKAAAARKYAFGARDRCDETAMTLRTVRDHRYRYIRSLTPQVPFLAPNRYKAQQYPLWTLLPRLQAEGKLTPEQAALCAPTTPPEQLFDLQSDPHQVRNLAGDPKYAEKLTELRAVLDRWMADVKDPESRG